MSKQHRDFVTYVRNGVEINALVAFSRDVYTSATQTAPASGAEHVTVVYLDASLVGGVPSGEALRNSIKIQMDVPPLVEGLLNGWKEVAIGTDSTGCHLVPVAHLLELSNEVSAIDPTKEVCPDAVIQSATAILKSANVHLSAADDAAADAADKLVQANAWIEQQSEKLSAADKLATKQDQEIAALKATVETKDEQVKKLLADINMLEERIQKPDEISSDQPNPVQDGAAAEEVPQ